MKVDVLFARFPYGHVEIPEGTNWLIETVLKCSRDPRVGKCGYEFYDDTPITMTRNRAVHDAHAMGIDYLVMLDNDMVPDVYRYPNFEYDGARPFWDSTLDFMLAHRDRPCVVGSPYCGPPPWENVYVFQPEAYESRHASLDFRPEQYGRAESTRLTGIQEVWCLPTGLIVFDMRMFEHLKNPFFDYEYEGDGHPCPACGLRKPGPRTKKATTEDVYTTRNLALLGVRQFCNWDAWSGHRKPKVVGRPQVLTVEKVIETYREGIARGIDGREKLVSVGENGANGHRHATPGDPGDDYDALLASAERHNAELDAQKAADARNPAEK